MLRSDAGTVVVSLDSSVASLERVHDGIQELWKRHPSTSDIDRMALELAVTELATNVIRHALYGSGGSAQLLIVGDGSQLTAQITDDGFAFVGDLDHIVMPGLDAESGRGLAVIDGLMDIFEYHRSLRQNHWTIIRRLSRQVAIP